MKNIILFIFLLPISTIIAAQSPEQGQQHLYYERYESAKKNFTEYVKAHPDDARAWYGLTLASLLQNKEMVAGQGLHAAPATIHNEPLYLVSMGSIFLSLGRRDSATFYFNQALDKTRNRDAEVLAAIARAHVELPSGDANYAIELLNKAIKRDKNNPSFYVLLGDAWKKSGSGSEAFSAYKNAYEENQGYAAAYHKTGEIFLTQKNPEMYLEYYNKAIAADPEYAPSLYRLYAHYFFHDAAKALDFYHQYMANADLTIRNEYELADLFYLNRQFETAIGKANKILDQEGDKANPRLFKLLGYSASGLKDSVKAISYFETYFNREADSNVIAKDYETMGDLYHATEADSLAMIYYAKAAEKETDPELRFARFKKLATIAAELKDYTAQANWLSRYYTGNEKATNVDLFNWGLAHYRGGEYGMADSIFGIYVSKYPEQSFGYYWQARSNVARDTDIENGLAVPHYQKLIEILQQDTDNTNYKKWLVEAYAYLAAYEANTQKDYKEAVDYFEKVLEVDPENLDAKKYIAILEKNLVNDGEK